MTSSYNSMTLGDPNPFKRFLHKKRYDRALQMMPDLDGNSEILDFAAGDGQLAHYLLKKYPNIKVTLFEPAIQYADEAKKSTAELGDKVRVVTSFDEIANAQFSSVFCLSLFEHLAQAQQLEALQRIHSVSAPDTQTLVEVPNELYTAAAVKGLFRHHRRPLAFDGKLSNIMPAIVGRPPADRPVYGVGSMSATELPWHSSHLGFDHRNLEEVITQTGLFELDGPTFAPINSAIASLDIYYLLRPVTA